jgi:valyl-tRNA synthetase
MSKSLGNSPDPLDLIAQYGADGLRFGILSMAPQGQDIFFNESGVAQGRNFCNKLWNAARFREMSGPLADNSSPQAILSRLNPSHMDGDDHAILAKLIEVTQSVEAFLANYEFSQATQALYSFFWGDYCDWYLEVAKSRFQDATHQPHLLAIQDFVIRQVLLLLHPFAPFITEELWHGRGYGVSALDFIQNHAPIRATDIEASLAKQGICVNGEAAKEIDELRVVVSQARALKAQYGLQSQKSVQFSLQIIPGKEQLLTANQSKLIKLIGAEAVALSEGEAIGPSAVSPWGTLTLLLNVAIDVEAERNRLSKELARLEKAVAVGSSKLQSPEFVSKAPPHIIEGARAQLLETQSKYNEVKRLIDALPKA